MTVRVRALKIAYTGLQLPKKLLTNILLKHSIPNGCFKGALPVLHNTPRKEFDKACGGNGHTAVVRR
jgi:hypothetical protein